MINTEYFKNKKVTIIGLARSGLSCANLLSDLGAEVSASDNNDNDATRINASGLKSKNIKLELGKHSQEFIKGKDFIVISPGVADTSLPIVWAQKFGIPIISEIEVASILCPATIIATTGTNGKTTVTTLIGKILEAQGKKVIVCGNIGNPFCGEVAKLKESDYVSLEVSSFQLERIESFKPKIALILNISRNHLDRYNNMQDYLGAKKRIFINQDKADYLVLNRDDQKISDLAQAAKANVVYFSRQIDFNPNQSAVLAVASILGIDKSSAQKVFREFKGVEHRLEFVVEINKIKFVNDSKATTVDATIWALTNILSPVVLIAGGREKGNDYSLIRDLAKEKLKNLILIGEAKERIKESFKDLLSIDEASNLEEAVNKAFVRARPGDCVLFSPMCKSFDMFTDYEERGRVFKEIVLKLSKYKG